MTTTIIFYDRSFPYAGERPAELFADQLRQHARFVVADALTLADALDKKDAACLVHLHGPYFPKAAWPSILSFLRRGGGMLHAGGAPFRLPVVRSGDDWSAGAETAAYHQQLQIQEALAIGTDGVQRLSAQESVPLMAGREHLFDIRPTFGLVLHVTHQRDIPAESGSNGPMDAHITPLLRSMSTAGRAIVAPAVLLENTKGEFAGGRWILINQELGAAFWNEEGMEALAEWAAYCERPVKELWLKPGYAVYYAGERAAVRIQSQQIRRKGHSFAEGSGGEANVDCELRLYREGDVDCLWSLSVRVPCGRDLATATVVIPVEIERGLHRIECLTHSDDGEQRLYNQGLWGYDKELLETGEPLACGTDYFLKQGKPFPVVGMTYMASDVSRKFVFLPNVAVWDRDMATMKKAGINLIRTGLWTGWRHVMFADGHASEEALRAIDAFVLTARKHDMEVTFTFFAFTPEAWEGDNPYLDPRSVEAQRRFIASIVSRHRRTTNVNWDFINEPSLFDPKRIFTGPRPLADRYETAAFSRWLSERHESIEQLQERWNMTPDELPDFARAVPPEQHEISFDIENMRFTRKNNRWLDYTLFTMDMHNWWAGQMAEVIRSIAPNHLITVGQDEALGRGPRPSPFFYAEAVDYTTVHTWWLNDHLVWDGVFAKTPGKPNLVQETGIMYLETPDNRAKRSEAELRDLLERKYAYAFSTGGAGAVQWVWNTNFYMNNVNESNIGALRADGTEKPEADVSYDFGAFMREVGYLFEGRSLEDIAVIFPYSNDFSSRRLAFEATANAARVLAYRLKLPFRALGEYHLDSLEEPSPRLIIVPSPHNFGDEALDRLIVHVARNGGVLLFTGPSSLDAYWHTTERHADLFGVRRIANVSREETMLLEGIEYPVSFGGKKTGEVSKEISPDRELGAQTAVQRRSIGNGEAVWCPLPIELGEGDAAVAALYRYAAELAGAQEEMIWLKGGDNPGVYGRRLRFAQGSLYIFVSEYAGDTDIEVEDKLTGVRYSLILPSGRCMLFAVNLKGELLASYRQAFVGLKHSNRP